MKILGAIIAGGKSSRMGGKEKCFLTLGGVTLLERIASRIGFQVDKIVINANGDKSRFSGFNFEVVPDDLEEVGTPLAGLHAALNFAAGHGYDAVLTVPSDSPLVPLDLVARLKEAGEVTGAAFAHSGGHDHVLTGLWTSAMARPLERLMRSDNLRRVQDFARRARAEKAVWAVAPHDPFFNINTPEDLAEAERIAKSP